MPRTQTLVPRPGALADLCLGHLAEDPAQLADFLGATGYDPQSLRAALGSAELQLALIDYFASNEGLLLAFCANADLAPETFMRVWHELNPSMG
ncbi:DUF3572 family protein [Arsenicitalea aurantiaca]|uniref:DUF3572 family protein n=1 Tax=Arsenicitalea aurantiaca TaxID=1783274 RepID=UPI0013155239|nr:DUF3572 family protein [Arsenicitalea aurantiaca]